VAAATAVPGGRNRTHPIQWAVPAEWIYGLERMRLKTCPTAIKPEHWLQLQDAAKRFVELWGGQAAGLGWLALDIFGCHPERPSDYYDCMGLIRIVAGADLRLMGTGVVTLQTRSGRLMRVSKPADVRGRILIWDLAPGGSEF
jgi:hypothetical protein